MVVVKELWEYKIQPMQKTAILTLLKVMYFLGQKNIYAWISAGTALWLYRDGKFIDHDTDIDIWVIWWEIVCLEDIWGRLVRTMYEGFNVMQKMYLLDWVLVDFYYFYPEWDKLVNYNEHWKMSKTKRCIKRVVPNMMEYLWIRFGANRHIPTKWKQDWTLDCKNLKNA